MKSVSVCFFLFFFTAACFAQNVGVGTSTPSNLLTVHGQGQTVNVESTDNNTRMGFYVTNGFCYLQTHSNHDLLFATNNGASQMTLQKSTGNLGIGTTYPTAKLDVNGSFKLTTGTEAAGKVLTSDATGNATWQNAAYGNTERFGVKLKGSQNAATTLSTLYNSGTTVTGFSRSNTATEQTATVNLLFSKAGLYHLSFSISSKDYSNIGNGSNLDVGINHIQGATTTEICTNYLPLYNGGNGWTGNYDKELELVIPAGASIVLLLSIPASLTQFWNLDAFITGHLISE